VPPRCRREHVTVSVGIAPLRFGPKEDVSKAAVTKVKFLYARILGVANAAVLGTRGRTWSDRRVFEGQGRRPKRQARFG
jgi:hypothetical protein